VGGRFIETFRSPRMDFKESIPLAYVAWRAGATTLYIPTTFLEPPTVDCSKIPAQAAMYSENAGYALTQPSNPPPPPHSTEPGTDNLWFLRAFTKSLPPKEEASRKRLPCNCNLNADITEGVAHNFFTLQYFYCSSLC
jgi:hypothetical protein